MQKKYVVLFISILFRADLQADGAKFQKKNPLIDLDNTTLNLAQKLRANGILFELQKTNNDQTTSVFIVPETVPDLFFEQDSIKKSFRKIKKRNFLWGKLLSRVIHITAGLFLSDYIFKPIINKILEKSIPLNHLEVNSVNTVFRYMDNPDDSGNFTNPDAFEKFIISDELLNPSKQQKRKAFMLNIVNNFILKTVSIILIEYLVENFALPQFNKWNNSKVYLEQLKDIDFDTHPVFVLKLPNEFIKTAISFLEAKGFKLI